MAAEVKKKKNSNSKIDKFQIQFGDWLRKKDLLSGSLIFAVFALIIAFMTVPESILVTYPVSENDVGAVIRYSVRANRDYSIVDEEKTQSNRIEAQSRVPRYFQTVDADISEKNINRSFSQMRIVAKDMIIEIIKEEKGYLPEKFHDIYAETILNSPQLFKDSPYKEKIMELFNSNKNEFDKIVGFPVSSDMFLILAQNLFCQKIQKSVVDVISRINAYAITREGIPEDYPLNHIAVRKGDTMLSVPVNKVITGYTLREEIKYSQKILEQEKFFSKDGLKLIELFVFWAVKDNIVFSPELTEAKKLEAWNNAPREEFRIKNGEIVLRAGEVISPREITIFKEMKRQSSERSFASTYLNNLLYILLLVTILFIAFKRSVSKFRYNNKDVVLMGMQTVFILLLFDVIGAFSTAFSQYMGSIDSRVFYFLIPVPFAVAIIRLLINTETAVFYLSVLSMVFLLMFPDNYYFPVFYFIGSMAYLFLVTHIERRGNILRVSFFLSLILIVLTVLIFTMDVTLPSDNIPRAIFLTFTGAMFSGMLLMAFIPIYEWFLGYTTDIAFLEYSTLNHPLMKQMAVYANGTYQHSLTVGSIVEVASRAIGVSPLACKVMAYFHDIGKLERPQYFTENQSGKNLHDDLPSYSMSAMVIINHVKKGLELARKYRLGEKIEDAVTQHHGTTLVEYFYRCAKKEDPSIGESPFQYPGPKPQTRETALLMIADSVEASVRSIPDKSFQKISDVVQKIIRQKLEEDQFSECSMTLKDLKIIEESCIKTLSGIYHARVEYPDK
jgi:putative nucleotidyltransferase with HDIG domain